MRVLKGTVSFEATLTDSRLDFPRFEFRRARHPDIEKIELESANGTIRATVHFATVATRQDAERVGAEGFEAVLSELAYDYNLAIENARRTSVALTRVNPIPDVLEAATGEFVAVGQAVVLAIGLGRANVETLRTKLERATPPPGEPMYGLFRIALCATSPVERFMLLYHVLSALLPDRNGEDSQREVDTFIRREQPGVVETPHPRRPWSETIYSRLRNELAHRRPGVDLRTTRTEIAAHVGGLVNLAKRAIELYG